MEITPEIIATKIWKWRWDQKLDCWVSPEGHRFFDITFKESEWTGPLLEKAASMGTVWIWLRPGQKSQCSIYPKPGMGGYECINDDLNYAIAEAILEAERK